MSDETKGLVKFWTAYSGLIILLITAAIFTGSRMAVIEEKVRSIESREVKMEKMDEELKKVNSLLIEINTNQKSILKKLDK